MRAKNILIIGPAWVGDMVMVQSLFKSLKRENSDHVIDVLAPKWSAPVLARMPEINNIIEVDLRHGQLQMGQRYAVGKSLRGKYEQAIILPRSFKSALIPVFAKIPQRTAYRGEMRYAVVNDMRDLNTDVTYKAVEKYVNLGRDKRDANLPLKILTPELNIDETKRHVAAIKLGVSESSPAVALMPGAEFGPSKCWPAEYFGELALKFSKQGYEVYIFGSKNDFEIGEVVAKASNNVAKNLCGKTTLEEVVDLISLIRVAITNDSGLMHIAAAVKCPVVAIYGAITPKYTPPLTNKSRIEYLHLDCSPCWKKTCPYGHYNCLRKLEVDRVFNSASQLLAHEIH